MNANSFELNNIIIDQENKQEQVISLSSNQDEHKPFSANQFNIDDKSLIHEETNLEDTYISEKTKQLRVKELAEKYGVQEDKLLKKIDIYLVPACALLVVLSYMNKTSFGILITSTVLTDIHIGLGKFAGIFAAFYAPYVVFQFFSNFILKRVRPHFWLAFSVLSYGAVCAGCGFVKTYTQFVVCQFLHGLFQSGTETALYYIIAHYYSQTEALKRFSAIFSAACLGGLLATLVAYGCDIHLVGVKGHQAWQWFLLIEGSITMAGAFIIFFTLPDFPEGARFLSDDEAIFLVKKLEMFTSKSGYNLNYTKREVWKTLCDPMIYLPAAMGFCMSFVVMGVTTIAPLVVVLLGWDGIEAKRRVIYPYVVTLVWCNFWAWISDWIKMRFPVLMFNCLVILAGGIAVGVDFSFHFHDKTKYGCVFVFMAGGFCAIPLLLCWATLNLGGHLRKSVGIAANISVSSLGAMLSYFVFVGNKPSYKPGMCTGIALISLCIVILMFYLYYIYKENQKKRTVEYKKYFDSLSEREKIILGDKAPSFDYMY